MHLTGASYRTLLAKGDDLKVVPMRGAATLVGELQTATRSLPTLALRVHTHDPCFPHELLDGGSHAERRKKHK